MLIKGDDLDAYIKYRTNYFRKCFNLMRCHTVLDHQGKMANVTICVIN
jgi:hypothetical protein